MSIKTYNEAAAFHGHSCPGLALGYRAAEYALQHLRAGRSEDEDLVAVVENDACGVDAIQLVAGCSAGKGNLILRDFGKHAVHIHRSEIEPCDPACPAPRACHTEN